MGEPGASGTSAPSEGLRSRGGVATKERSAAIVTFRAPAREELGQAVAHVHAGRRLADEQRGLGRRSRWDKPRAARWRATASSEPALEARRPSGPTMSGSSSLTP